MTVDIEKRLRIDQALQHPWLKQLPGPSFPRDSPLSTVTLKTVDVFFGHDVDSEIDDVEKAVKKIPSSPLLQFDRVGRLIVDERPVRMASFDADPVRTPVGISPTPSLTVLDRQPSKMQPKPVGLTKIMGQAGILVKPVIQKRPI
jgi:hypothetical protein